VSAARRVLLINYEYPPLGGGAGTATAAIARALAALGCDVVVLTSRFRGQPAREQVDGYTLERVRVARKRMDRCTPPEMLTFLVSASIAALRLTRRWRPAVSIAFFTIPSGPVAWLLHKARGVPYIVSLRGGDVPGFEWAPEARTYHRLTGWLVRFIWRRAQRVVANSNGLAELARKNTPELAIDIAFNGAELPGEVVPPGESNGRPARLLTMGRLTRQKGVDVLLRALARLRDLPFVLDVAGDGPERSALEQQARELGLADRVRFLGWITRDQLRPTYTSADLFVLASRIEGMPNVVLEAMAYARPVICTRVSGCAELILHGQTGLQVNIEDDEQLAEALRKLLLDPSLRTRMGAASRARVAQEFTWTATARRYLELAERN
jgi:glycosyltransferase involved in cell wall biosynthesis